MLLSDVEEIVACADLEKRCDIILRVSANCKQLTHLSPENALKCVKKLAKCVTLPNDEYGETHSSDDIVKLHCRNAYLICSLMSQIISQELDTMKDNSRSLLPQILTTSAPLLTRINPWSNEDCNGISDELLKWVAKVCEVEDVKMAINQEMWLFEDTFERIYSNLEGEAWKKSTMAEYTFIFLIENTDGDLLVKFLDRTLPILLNLIDDITPRHARNGMKCVRHILEEVPPAELRYRGRIDVLYDALSRKIHLRDPDLLEELIPCVLLSLRCIETEMMRKRGVRIPKYDECFDAVLTNFHLASEVGVKRAFAKMLPAFVSHLGIQIIGHMKMVFIVLEYGFETADLVTMGYLCKMITEMVNVAWLRMATHAEKLIEFLVKTLYSIENDHWRTAYVSQEDLNEATKSITKTIAKLSSVNKELVMETVAMMKSAECLGLGSYAFEVQQLLS